MWLSLFSEPARAGLPLRERVCAALRAAIAQGHLRQGERLPSTRVLAADLAVSRVTAEAAYAQLEAEGVLERRVGRGTTVRILPAPSPEALPEPGPLPPPRLSQRGAAIAAGGACLDPGAVRAFSAGCPDLRAFPVDTWRQLTSQCLRTHGSQLMGYGDPQGEASLRAAIAHYLGQARGVRCDASQVVVVTSSQQALGLLANLLLDPGDRVLVEEPGYLGARTAFLAAGALLTAAPVDADGLRVPEQDAPARLVYTTPSHQYPSGVTLHLSRRLALLEHARRHDSWVIEDDYDSEFQYDARPAPAMQGLDRHGRVIYLGTFSKALFPALRLAYMVLPPSLVAGSVVARTVQDGHCNRLAQAVTAEFIARGHFAAHIRRMRLLYAGRRRLLLDALRADGPAWLAPQAGGGGLQLACWLLDGSEAALTRQGEGLGLALPTLSRLYLGPKRRDGWLLGFAGLQNPEILAGVAQLARLVA
jgi:GntR family transcriptional regulator/MocR family aminotransferase